MAAILSPPIPCTHTVVSSDWLQTQQTVARLGKRQPSLLPGCVCGDDDDDDVSIKASEGATGSSSGVEGCERHCFMFSDLRRRVVKRSELRLSDFPVWCQFPVVQVRLLFTDSPLPVLII